MTQLIASLGVGKGSWAYLKQLIEAQDWSEVFIVTNQFGAERFAVEGKRLNFIIIDEEKELSELVVSICAQLEGKLAFDAAINLVSGSGKQHMALLSAVLKQGIGIRLIDIKDQEAQEV
jgi:hypothetical protein